MVAQTARLSPRIFDLVHRHMKQLCDQFPRDIETFERHVADGFLHIPLLGISASQALVSRIAEDVLNGALDNLTFIDVTTQPALRTSILRFMLDRSIDSDTYRTVKHFFRNTRLWKGLLLLRGLLAHGILVYVLSQRRWRVDYGLDLKRSLLAVPYRAKVYLKPFTPTPQMLTTSFFTGYAQPTERVRSSRCSHLLNVLELLLRRSHTLPSGGMLRSSQ